MKESENTVMETVEQEISEQAGGQLFQYGKPYGTRLIVKADEAEEITKGGIIIPEMAKERPQFGTVLAIGEEVKEDIRPGDRVVYGKHAGTPLVIQEQTFFIMQEREIFMKLDQEALDRTLLGAMPKTAADEENSARFTTDKSSYKVGDQIVVAFKSKYPGSAITTVKAGKKVIEGGVQKHTVVEGLNTLLVRVASDMVPEINLELELNQRTGNTSYDIPAISKADISLEIYA
jgi:chaperonin GroES